MKNDKGLVATMTELSDARSAQENPSERWKRIYRTTGGPLVAWLLDEAVAQQMDASALARELGVTTGYLAQLHSGVRDPANISREFAAACGVFLGVPAVVVQVVAGHLTLLDFVCATDLDRWAERLAVEGEGEAAQLVGGSKLGRDELWLLPNMVQVLKSVASVHQTRARLG